MFSFAKFGLLCTLAFSAATAVTAAPIAQEQGHDTPMRRGNSGKATYYSVGQGACGGSNSGSDSVVAMNSAQYSSGSYCGKTISITNTANGNTASGTVVDECPGCGEGSLDLSQSLFSQLSNGDTSEGTFPITWS